jgi:hypothetical protein
MSGQLEAFMQHVFGDVPDDEIIGIVQRGKEGRGWQVTPYKNGRTKLRPDAASYYCISTLKKPPEGEPLRRLMPNMARCHVIVLDDIGTKIDAEKFKGKAEPHYVMETSAGNFQYGLLFDGTLEEAQVLIEAMIEAGYSDPGARDVHRLVRLPGSLNYKSDPPFVAHLVGENWDQPAWTFKDLCEEFGLTPREPTSLRSTKRAWNGDTGGDVILKWITEKGMALSEPNSDGWLFIECPWADEHSDGRRDAKWQIGNGTTGSYHCFHGSCQHRTQREFLLWCSANGAPDFEAEAITQFTAIGQKLMALAPPEVAARMAADSEQREENDRTLRRNAEMNREYAVTRRGGLTVALHLDENGRVRGDTTQSFPQFKNFHGTAGDKWLRWSGRRQHSHVVFNPTCEPVENRSGEPFNLWVGFAVTPRPGDWSLLHDHIRDVICNGNMVIFTYVLNWIARLVQHPELPGEVALVIPGTEGAGKGIFVRFLKEIFGPHAKSVAKAGHALGKFNAQLEDTVLLFLDEAFAGDAVKEPGMLKAMLTEPTLFIEAKFQTPGEKPNRLHCVMASNEDWVVPAGVDSRRFCVTRASDRRRGDRAYFAKLYALLDHGGPAFLLHDMLKRDISGFNPGDFPVTEELQEQRVHGLESVHAWYRDLLLRGYLTSLSGDTRPWPEDGFVTNDALMADLTEFCRQQQINGAKRPTREGLGKFLKGKLKLEIVRPPGADRRRRYLLGTWGAARAAYTAATKLPAPE